MIYRPVGIGHLQGYQYYEFNMLKCLADESKKLAEKTKEDDTEEKTDEAEGEETE